MVKRLESLIFEDRWVIAPMYVGLIVGLILYTYKFMTQLWHLGLQIRTITEEHLMLGILSLVDITMVGNLIIMIMIGGYSIFVRRLVIDDHRSKPQWLDNISSSTLKIKMGMSLIGVSSIHLLKDFISEDAHIGKHVTIHIVFLLSTMALAWTNYMTHRGDSHALPVSDTSADLLRRLPKGTSSH